MYNLVTQTLGGDIEAFSKPGEGLRYIITIPV
jgi:signal transduction histidine kinase